MTDYMSPNEHDDLAADYKLYEAYPDDCVEAFCNDETKPAHLVAHIVDHYGEEISGAAADSAWFLETRSWRKTDKRTILADVIELRKRDTVTIPAGLADLVCVLLVDCGAIDPAADVLGISADDIPAWRSQFTGGDSDDTADTGDAA